MDRTLVSFNIPNLITIPLMAFLGFLLLAVVWQFVRRTAPGLAGVSGGDDGVMS